VNKNTNGYQCLILVGTNKICQKDLTGTCDMHFPALELVIVIKLHEMKAAYITLEIDLIMTLSLFIRLSSF